MVAITKQALMYAENLSLPSVVIVSANMGCSYCRDRVSQLLNKITGLEEYTVDVLSRQVVMKGEFGYKRIDYNKKSQNKGNIFKLFIRFLKAAFICR